MQLVLARVFVDFGFGGPGYSGTYWIIISRSGSGDGDSSYYFYYNNNNNKKKLITIPKQNLFSKE